MVLGMLWVFMLVSVELDFGVKCVFCECRESSATTMATRNCDIRLSILTETPGFQHLEMNGNRLPTYNQVLLCYLSHMEKQRLEDISKNVGV